MPPTNNKASAASELLAAALLAAGTPTIDDPSVIPPELITGHGITEQSGPDEYEDEENAPSAPSTDVNATTGGGSCPQDPDMVYVPVYDSATDDYVTKLVPRDSLRVASNDREHDGFAIADAYYQGEGADYDYRWIPKKQEQQLNDRSHGFVPVRKLLDNRYRMEGGSVTNGDLILARRPKWVTDQRAVEQADLTARLSGEFDAIRDAAQRNGSDTFGDIDVDGDRIPAARQADLGQVHERLEQQRKGSKSFAFHVPWGRDRLAELELQRQRAAVGG